MDALQKAVLATEILAERFGLDPIFLQSLRVQSGDPFARLSQQNEAMADVLWEITQKVADMPSPPTPLPSEHDGEIIEPWPQPSPKRREKG